MQTLNAEDLNIKDYIWVPVTGPYYRLKRILSQGERLYISTLVDGCKSKLLHDLATILAEYHYDDFFCYTASGEQDHALYRMPSKPVTSYRLAPTYRVNPPIRILGLLNENTRPI